MAKRKKKKATGPWSDSKLLGWSIFWTVIFFPVGIPMLIHYFVRKKNRVMPPVLPWSSWGRKIHENQYQAERMRRAMASGYKFRPTGTEGVFSAKGSEGTTYFVSFGGCSCPDFGKRGKPCKHMYALAIQEAHFDPSPFLWYDD